MMVVSSLVDDDFLSAAQIGDGGGFELAAGFLGDHGAAGQDGNILQHSLAAIAKARGLDGHDVEHAAQFVQHQGSQRFAVNIFGDDDQVALADLDQFLQDGDDICCSGDFLVVDQDVRIADEASMCSGSVMK